MKINHSYFDKFKTDVFFSNVLDEVKEFMLEEGKKHLNYKWESLLASDYLKYEYTGDRKDYESIYFRKRKILAYLTFGYLISKENEYLMAIIDGIYSLCEESTWVVPAHGQILEEVKDAIIHDPDYFIIDLFSSETGALLSFVYYLLSEELDRVTPLIRKRIKKEIEKRIIHPYLTIDRFWWMGLRSDSLGEHVLNNWNPWCNMNSLIALLLVEENVTNIEYGINKCVKSVEAYLEVLPDDGGLDEGATYWGHASGNLYFICEYLYQVSDGKINLFENHKIKNLATYIYKAHIKNNYFLSYADSNVINTEIPISIVYGYGEIYHHKELTNLAKILYQSPQQYIDRQSWLSMGKVLLDFELSSFIKNNTESIEYEDVWLEQSQIMCTREDKHGEGFFLSCKGSHNGESHNHNDVGNFIVYYNGEPVIIDVGVGSYTKDTFSDKRYDIWTMQSGYHNLPIINGYMQQDGIEFACTNVLYKNEYNTCSLSMDIHTAYPKEAFIKRWRRLVSLNKIEKEIMIKETIEFRKEQIDIILNMMFIKKPLINNNGSLSLITDHKELLIEYPEELVRPMINEILICDERLRKNLPEKVYQLQFILKETLLATTKIEIDFIIH